MTSAASIVVDVKDAIDWTDLMRSSITRMSWYKPGSREYELARKDVKDYAQRIYKVFNGEIAQPVVVKEVMEPVK